MPMKDTFYGMGVRPALGTTAHTTGTTPIEGVVVDLMGFRSLTFAVDAKYGADTAPTYELSLLHSEGGTTFTPVPAIMLIKDVPVSSTAPVTKIGYAGYARYVKLVVTPSAAASAAVNLHALAILQTPHVAPAA